MGRVRRVTVDDSWFAHNAPADAVLSILGDRNGVFGALANCLLHLGPELAGRRLVEDVQESVVTDLENLGQDAHAHRVGLAQVEIDHDSPAHDTSIRLLGRGIVSARPVIGEAWLILSSRSAPAGRYSNEPPPGRRWTSRSTSAALA